MSTSDTLHIDKYKRISTHSIQVEHSTTYIKFNKSIEILITERWINI